MRQWLEEEYPAIRKQAKREKARIQKNLMKNLMINIRGYSLFIIIVFMLTVCFETTCFSGQTEHIQMSKSIFIRLEKMHFDPLKKVPEAKPGSNVIKGYKSGETGYYIVQFDGPIEGSRKMALREKGVEIFDYIQDLAVIVRMDSRKEQTVRGLPHVRWLGSARRGHGKLPRRAHQEYGAEIRGHLAGRRPGGKPSRG